jgi:PucR C-terminal helix-turn-helix domain
MMMLERTTTGPNAGPALAGTAFSAETAAVVRSSLGGAIPEMIEAIGRAVPEYARPAGPSPDNGGPDDRGGPRPDYQQRLADAVTGAVASFIARVAQPDRSMEPVLDEFRVIGGTAAREGRTLDGLQDALRLGARVAWRWLCEAGAALDRRELSRVGEAVFGYLDELAAACARGYAEAGVLAAGDRQRRLLDLILADPPPRPEQVAALARAADWILPAQVAVAVLGRQPRGHGPDTLLLPPGVLVDWTAADPCLLIPDPDGPGRQAALDRALLGRPLPDRPLPDRALPDRAPPDRVPGGRPAVIGPSVPLARAAQSLRWARHARSLVQSGVIPAGTGPDGNGPVRCDQHLSTLLILAHEDLAAALSDRHLAPLARLRPGQRDRIAETLLAWLQLGENAAEVAQRIHVHPQTVRYRLRQITELFGDQLRDPDCRFELQLALRIRTLRHT